MREATVASARPLAREAADLAVEHRVAQRRRRRAGRTVSTQDQGANTGTAGVRAAVRGRPGAGRGTPRAERPRAEVLCELRELAGTAGSTHDHLADTPTRARGAGQRPHARATPRTPPVGRRRCLPPVLGHQRRFHDQGPGPARWATWGDGGAGGGGQAGSAARPRDVGRPQDRGGHHRDRRPLSHGRFGVPRESGHRETMTARDGRRPRPLGRIGKGARRPAPTAIRQGFAGAPSTTATSADRRITTVRAGQQQHGQDRDRQAHAAAV